MVCTTLPKVDKAGTSSAGVPTAQALVVRSGSKVPDGNLADDDLDPLILAAAKFEIVYWTSSGCRCAGLTQGNRTVQFGISDGLVFVTTDADPAFLVFGHENVEGGLWALLRLAPSFFCHCPPFGVFGLIIHGGCSSSMMTSLPLVDSA
jgi:hypothetical protein